MTRRSPPRLAAFLISVITPRTEREFVLGDLEEQLADRGRMGAWAWYWGQVLRSAGRLVLHTRAADEDAATAGRRHRRMLPSVVSDVRYSLRRLSKTPGFTAVIVLTLAVGIGANTAIFSVVSGVLLQPLPYDEPGDLVAIWSRFTPESGYDFPKYPAGSPEYFDYVNQNRSMLHVGAVSTEMLTITQGSGEPEMVEAGYVSSSAFSALRTPPLLGRTLLAEDDGVEPRPVFVLSYDFWQRRFGGDTSVVGQMLEAGLDNEDYGSGGRIVGVMPQGFAFPTEQTKLWTQLPLDPARTWRGGHWFWMIGRLAPGVSFEQADAEMKTLMAQWAIDYPDHHVGHGLYLTPLLDDAVGDVRSTLLFLLGAVGVVLLIACANVANLLLARSEGARREFAVRGALGASRGRLVQQLLTDCFLLSAAGGLIGTGVSHLGVRALLALEGGGIPRIDQIGLDGRVLAFTGAVVVLTTLIFGLVPAIKAGASDLQDTLSDAGRRSTAGRSRLRLRGALVIAETAFAIVLVLGAGLLTKSFWHLLQQDPGFKMENLLLARFSLPSGSYTADEAVNFYEELTDGVRALPGVESVALTSRPPLLSHDTDGRFHIDGKEGAVAGEFCCTGDGVSAAYGLFHTLGIPLLRGRLFDETDLTGGPLVVIVDEELARRYWPGDDPIGKRIRFFATDGPWHTVVGVVGKVKYAGLDKDYPIFYHQYHQTVDWSRGFISRSNTLVVRTVGDPVSIAGPVRELVRTLDPALPIVWMRTMDDIAAASVARPRFVMTLLSVFAGVALLLGAIGVYGVISHAVAMRTNEIGIRIALGAGGGAVTRLVVRQGMQLTWIGVAVGLAAAIAATRLIRGFLFEISPTDPLTFAAVTALMVVVGMAACYVPARRASRIDPLSALRQE